MSKAKVKLSLSERDIPNKVELGRKVSPAITTNIVTFISPLPTMAELDSVTDDLEIAFAASKHGLLSTALLHEAEDAWDTIMTAVGNYVDAVAKGSRGIVNLAELDATESSHTAIVMTKVVGVEGRMGAVAGELFFKWEKVKGCRIYRGFLFPDGGGPAEHVEVFSTKAKLFRKGLVPGVKYTLVLEAIGASGIGPASDPASAYAAH
jgi:hypothetical protein